MNLLILTQKVDKRDDNLGFFHHWLEKFAEKTDKMFVITNFVGEYSLPANAQVFSLGKEKGFGRIRRYFNFYKYIFEELPKSDAVFIHMIPAWVILVWPVAAIFRKKIYLWYTHKSVTFSLWLAEKLVSKIFTASPESCRLRSKKIVATGHGIDTERFKSKDVPKAWALKLLSVGRITPSKDYKFIIEAVGLTGRNAVLDIIGEPVTEIDVIYKAKLEKLVLEKNLRGKIIFLGAKTQDEMPEIYNSHNILVHASETGSIDKAVLEAMACGLPAVTTSEAFRGMLAVLPKGAAAVAGEITKMAGAGKNLALRELVVKNHNLENLIGKIIANIR